MASRRRNRRRGERRVRATRSRDTQRGRQSDAEPAPLSRFSFSNISTDWIAGGIIFGVVLVAVMVFLFAQILRGGGGGVSGFIQISGIAVHPSNPAVVLLADSNGLFRSIDGGGVWEPAAFDGEAVRSVAPDPAQAGAFYAAGNGVLARSADGGLTWRDLAVDLPSTDIRAFAADPKGGDLYTFVQGGDSTGRATAAVPGAPSGWKAKLPSTRSPFPPAVPRRSSPSTAIAVCLEATTVGPASTWRCAAAFPTRPSPTSRPTSAIPTGCT